jgi:phenylacetate-CoA ligase
MAQGLYTCGVRRGDIVQLATVFSLFMGGWGSLLGVERLGATAFPLGAGETERQLELMHRVGSTVLITTPTYALHMLETAKSLGYDPAASPLRLGIFIGEPGSSIPGTRHALETGWGITVRDMATTSEMTPWATNAECEKGNGVHVMQDGLDRDRRQGRFELQASRRRERRDRLYPSAPGIAADDPVLCRR